MALCMCTVPWDFIQHVDSRVTTIKIQNYSITVKIFLMLPLYNHTYPFLHCHEYLATTNLFSISIFCHFKNVIEMF